MVAKATVSRRVKQGPLLAPLPSALAAAADHAVRLIYRVCCLAGSTNLIEEFRDTETGLPDIISRRDTAALFDWLVGALSYQGISDRVAYEYMRKHGHVTWRALQRDMGNAPSCPKLQSYWHFHGCRYDKGSRTCAEPEDMGRCPLPRHQLRNGRLNQTAYSLYLFVRDIADGDLVGWIDNQLQEAAMADSADGLAAMREALIGPLRNVFGVSDKVLTMTLSAILISAPATWPRWVEVGTSMITVDTLVHNFLVRTGILHRLGADHPYGGGCYRPGGCADILSTAAARIDASKFNPDYPQTFARFVQHAIWQYCAQQGLDICNGNQIDDRQACGNIRCNIFAECDRRPLNSTELLGR